MRRWGQCSFIFELADRKLIELQVRHRRWQHLIKPSQVEDAANAAAYVEKPNEKRNTENAKQKTANRNHKTENDTSKKLKTKQSSCFDKANDSLA